MRNFLGKAQIVHVQTRLAVLIEQRRYEQNASLRQRQTEHAAVGTDLDVLDGAPVQLPHGFGDATEVLDGCERHVEFGNGSLLRDVLVQKFFERVVRQAIRCSEQGGF